MIFYLYWLVLGLLIGFLVGIVWVFIARAVYRHHATPKKHGYSSASQLAQIFLDSSMLETQQEEHSSDSFVSPHDENE